MDACNILCARLVRDKPVIAKPIEELAAFPQPGSPEGDELRMAHEDCCKLRDYDSKTGVPVEERLEEPSLTELANKLDSILVADE